MAGTAIAIKNAPPELHFSLKESARRHKRSLNQEAIHVLETSLSMQHVRRSSHHQPPSALGKGKILVSPRETVGQADDMLDR